MAAESTTLSLKKTNCNQCKKKLGIMVHVCKCEKQFCITHLNDHSCQYDYKTEGKKKLESQLIIGQLSQKVIPI